MAGSTQPDVLLDIPNLQVDEITVDVANLDVNIALDAKLASLLTLTAGANVTSIRSKSASRAFARRPR